MVQNLTKSHVHIVNIKNLIIESKKDSLIPMTKIGDIVANVISRNEESYLSQNIIFVSDRDGKEDREIFKKKFVSIIESRLEKHLKEKNDKYMKQNDNNNDNNKNNYGVSTFNYWTVNHVDLCIGAKKFQKIIDRNSLMSQGFYIWKLPELREGEYAWIRYNES
jgi:hypothetical protein